MIRKMKEVLIFFTICNRMYYKIEKTGYKIAQIKYNMDY